MHRAESGSLLDRPMSSPSKSSAAAPAPLPQFPQGLTAQFLTGVLHDDGALPTTGRVDEVVRESFGDGTGLSSELAKLTLTYAGDQGDAPRSMIAKFLPNNEANRASALAFNLPEREVRFAAELDPLTEAVTPRTYCERLDGQQFLLLMEDLCDYTVGSQYEGATLRQSELAIDELAKLHSAFWGKVDDLDWIPGIANSYHADALRGASPIGWEGAMERFDIPDVVTRHKDRFIAAIADLQSERMQAPITLVHGDFRMENLLYGNRPEHHDVVVIDWQGPLKARGMFDLSLFLTGSTKTEVRRAHEEDLLQRYLEGLLSRGVQGIDMDWIRQDYRHCILYDWVYTMVVAGTLDTSNEIAYRWIKQMVARHVEASIDHDVFSLLNN